MNKIGKILANNPVSNAIKNIRLLLDYDQKRRGVIMFLLLLLNSLLDVLGMASLIPLIEAAIDTSKIQSQWYLSSLYDFFGISDNVTFLLILSFLILLILTAKTIISVFIFYIQSKYSYNVALRISKKYYQHYFESGYLAIMQQDSGKRAYSILDIPRQFAQNYLLRTFTFGTELFTVLLIFIGILFYNPFLVLILISIVGPVFFMIYRFTKNRIKAIGIERNELYPKAYTQTLEGLESFIDLKLTNTEQRNLNQFNLLQKRINELDALNIGIYQKLPSKINEIVVGIGVFLIFVVAYIFPQNQAEILFILGLFGGAAFKVVPSVNKMLAALLVIKNNHYVIDELKKLANKKLIKFESVDALKIRNKIELRNISFEYPETNTRVLNDISLTISKGQVIGLIGQSGSGKTTLIKLLLRLLKETEGGIYVDNQLLDKSTNASFQKAIGFVQQDVFIKNGTIKENIAFGETTIDAKRLQCAIEGAALEEFVYSSTSGLETILGERGSKLSGGQKQRIGIARALYKEAQLLIFDEPTSALDNKTEKAITETLNKLAQSNMTILIIAHRISTLEKCDEIIELKDGQIKSTNNFAEIENIRLLKKQINE